MATSPNFSWPEPDNTDLVKNGALAIRTAVNAIDSSLVDLKGGTTGQVLAKATNTDMDFTWVAQDDSNAIQNAIVDAKGDLIAATADNTPARLAVGTDGHVLTADSTAATGLKWAAAAGGGKVLQVVSATYSTNTTSASATYADTGLTATITPSSASSKVLVLISQNGCGKQSADTNIQIRLMLNGVQEILMEDGAGSTGATTTRNFIGSISTAYLDSPASTSALTYKTQFANVNAAGTVGVQYNSSTSTITLMEIGA